MLRIIILRSRSSNGRGVREKKRMRGRESKGNKVGRKNIKRVGQNEWARTGKGGEWGEREGVEKKDKRNEHVGSWEARIG